VVTLGGQGYLALSVDLEHRLPAFEVEVVDTTGAGDTFTRVLTLRLALNDSLEEALRFASAAAALACQKVGAQAAMPWKAEIEALLSTQS